VRPSPEVAIAGNGPEVLARMEGDDLIETDRRSTGPISFTTEEEQVVVGSQAREREEVPPGHFSPGGLVPSPVDEDRDFVSFVVHGEPPLLLSNVVAF
jgi:hypothetical protein